MASLNIPSLEELSAIGASRALLLQFILNPSENQREVTVLVNSRIGSVTFVEGSFNLDNFLLSKDGPLPASKESIDSMPAVKIVQGGVECAICLLEFEVGGEAKEMPCKHKYHVDCVDRWLNINGSCPICRYKMPVDEENKVKDVISDESGDDSRRERRRDAPIVFHVFFGRDRNVYSDSNSNLNGQMESEEISTDTNIYSDSDFNSNSRVQNMDMSIAARDGDESSGQDMDVIRD